ncbi:MAG: GntR family transcriptional regulator [Burkholderiales bacterium]|nr:GntR family transcriptional regulator [Burkholderiales bacterium]
MTTWDDRQPIYRQLADRLAGALLDGEPPEGEPMPSVRALAARFMLNPLTVGRALQALADDGLLDNRRGVGLFVRSGARDRLRELERERFLAHEWPVLRTRLRRLGLRPADLQLNDLRPDDTAGDDTRRTA